MIRLKVEGMTCGHCEKAVEKALAAVPGVQRVVGVSREEQQAVVETVRKFASTGYTSLKRTKKQQAEEPAAAEAE